MNVPFAVAEIPEPSKPTVRFCENATNYRPLNQLFDHLVK
jgi:hypothetical protein